VSIITGGFRVPQGKIGALQAFAWFVTVHTWHTVVMVEWTEVIIVDDLKIRLVASKSGLRALQFHPFGEPEGERNNANTWMNQAANELHAYFAGNLRVFSVPLDMQGTEFQLSVWNHLLKIPYGETRSYAQVAEAVGRPKAVRAVGAANGSNPVAIIVPCHRVIGSSGKLTGYGGGLPLKKRLLELEGAWTMGLGL
jgi:methylated-DNA-[protein]-cysteine S-methyltransferase